MADKDKLRGLIAASFLEAKEASSQAAAKAILVDGLSLAVASYLVDGPTDNTCDAACHCKLCALSVQPPIEQTELVTILFAGFGAAFIKSAAALSGAVAKNGLALDISKTVQDTVTLCRTRHSCPSSTFVEYPANAIVDLKASVKQAFDDAEQGKTQDAAIEALSVTLSDAIDEYVSYCAAGLTTCAAFQPGGGGKGGGGRGNGGKGSEEPTSTEAFIYFDKQTVILDWLLGSQESVGLTASDAWTLTATELSE